MRTVTNGDAVTQEEFDLSQIDRTTAENDLSTRLDTLEADPISSTAAHAYADAVAASTLSASEAYALALFTGRDVKDSVRVATTANITLSGTQTIDGVAVAAGDRVLVKNQTTGSQNGIYVVASGAWTRATDADTSIEVTAGMLVPVTEGTVGNDTGWLLTTNDAIVLGTTSLAFAQAWGSGTYTAGSGLLLSSGVFTPDWGTGANNVPRGNDSRFSDARAPSAGSVVAASLGKTLDYGLANQTYHGLVGDYTAGEAITLGQVCYMKSDGKLWLAKGDAATTLPALYLCVTVAGVSANATATFLREGLWRNDSLSAQTVGGAIFLSAATGGAFTQTAPSATTQYIQKLGLAAAAKIIEWFPSLNYVKHA